MLRLINTIIPQSSIKVRKLAPILISNPIRRRFTRIPFLSSAPSPSQSFRSFSQSSPSAPHTQPPTPIPTSLPPLPLLIHDITPSPPTATDDDTTTTSYYIQQISQPLSYYQSHSLPVVVRGLGKLESPKAFESWNDLSYIQRAIGDDWCCDVEIGGPFSHGTTVRSTIRFEDYVSYLHMAIAQMQSPNDKNNCGGNENDIGDKDNDNGGIQPEHLVYLAQNNLPSSLYQDFRPPRVCTDGSVGRGSLYSTQLWLGPNGCVSPLHYDPLDNLLLHFVGRKVVVLYPPLQHHQNSERTDLDPYYAGLQPDGADEDQQQQQQNVSAVDIERPDYVRYPAFRTVRDKGVRVVLEEGDGLFIPKRWWHHVRSLGVWNLSVNCWWD